MVVRDQALAFERCCDRRPQLFGQRNDNVLRLDCAVAHHDKRALGVPQHGQRRNEVWFGRNYARIANAPIRPARGLVRGHGLHVIGENQMRHIALDQCRLAGQ